MVSVQQTEALPHTPSETRGWSPRLRPAPGVPVASRQGDTSTRNRSCCFIAQFKFGRWGPVLSLGRCPGNKGTRDRPRKATSAKHRGPLQLVFHVTWESPDPHSFHNNVCTFPGGGGGLVVWGHLMGHRTCHCQHCSGDESYSIRCPCCRPYECEWSWSRERSTRRPFPGRTRPPRSHPRCLSSRTRTGSIFK